MKFIPGLKLNELFYTEVVAPLLKRDFQNLVYSAALIGYGSDVLGFDSPLSMDHNWGPRLQIFLSEGDHKKYSGIITDYFRYNLPFEFMGFPTNFSSPRDDQTQSMQFKSSYPINHLIEVHTAHSYMQMKRYLGITDIENITTEDWLRLEDQKLLELTAGKVFHDGLGDLTRLRSKISFFPHNILLHRLAGLWKLIQDEEPFVGQSVESESFIGSKILSARLAEHCIKICFYLEKKYIPYSKWLIPSFRKLSIYGEVEPLAAEILTENNPKLIEDALLRLYSKVIEIHNRNKELPGITNQPVNFYNRPYKVIFAETIVKLLTNSISGNEL
ncbi:MAG TPA: DUF4037 domain-containing protein [Ignavibacteriales bacterium]|nr:DUF4037 domain-containing protein [Ignavibacteriales bacterium]